ncbi:tRNA pseudouridine(55) synthase TruB [bacterium]|nr:tRNA pseudouridine(55) synthase TruB [bacterium]
MLVDKPHGITSFDCIRKLKRLIPRGTKIGHGGTLDPFATGLIIVAIGRGATKHLGNLLGLDKCYKVAVSFGTEHDTLDNTGTEGRTCKIPELPQIKLEEILHSFTPGYEQVPPIFSALKSGGQSLCRLARKESPDMDELKKIAISKCRAVKIYNIELKSMDLPEFSFSVKVSKGTYIRSLVRDIGDRCNSCATTTALRRTRVGIFSVETAQKLETFSSADAILKNIISITKFHS